MEQKLYNLYYCTSHGTKNSHPLVSNADDIEDWVETIENFGYKLYEISAHESF